jgi:hypothetical protein
VGFVVDKVALSRFSPPTDPRSSLSIIRGWYICIIGQLAAVVSSGLKLSPPQEERKTTLLAACFLLVFLILLLFDLEDGGDMFFRKVS